MTELASNRDRHENLGDGRIGAEGMRRILGAPALQDLPVILEVPGIEGHGPDLENMRRARQFQAEGLAAAPTARGRRTDMEPTMPPPRPVCSRWSVRRRSGTIAVRNPFSGELIAEVATGGPAEIDRAVRDAVHQLPPLHPSSVHASWSAPHSLSATAPSDLHGSSAPKRASPSGRPAVRLPAASTR